MTPGRDSFGRAKLLLSREKPEINGDARLGGSLALPCWETAQEVGSAPKPESRWMVLAFCVA